MLTTPVGISEKGWVIACSADWYLYLSLYTQPNIEPTQGPSQNCRSENAIFQKFQQAWSVTNNHG